MAAQYKVLEKKRSLECLEKTEPRKVHADIQLHQQPTKQTKSPEPSQPSQL